MVFIILIGLSLMLLGGFLALTMLERGRGLRVAGTLRNRLDAKVSRAAFIVKHVDWGAFAKHLAGTATERVLHDIAHGVLRFVRSAERMLTRTVRTLRERRGLSTEDASDEGKGRIGAFLDKARVALREARSAARKETLRKAAMRDDA